MKCRKCGAEIPDNSIRCNNCGIKVNMLCPECKTLNLFGTHFCTKCGFELLKKCDNCGCLNVYSAEKCRKCDTPLTKVNEEIIPQDTNQIEVVESFSSDISDAHSEVVETVLSDTVIPEETGINLENTDSQIDIKPENIPSIDIETENEEQKTSPEIEQDTQPENEQEIYEEPQPEIQQSNNDIIDENIKIDEIEEIFDYDVQESLESENSENTVETSSEDYSKIEVQPDAVKKAIQSIKSSISKHIIAVHGPDGCGKTAVLRQTAQFLSQKGYLFLFGSCTPLLQITSFGFFQDALLRVMGFPPYTKGIESFIKDFKKSNLVKIFNFLNEDELGLFLNLIYPSQKDKFENILLNKQKMFSILEKVIKSFSRNNNLVITIDNFELLDGASYDFIVYMLQKGYFNNRLKLFAAYKEDKKIQSYFDLTKLSDEIFEVIELNKLDTQAMFESVKRSLHIDIRNIMDENYLQELVQKSQGDALRFEQEIALLFNSGYISVNNNEIIINEDNKPSIEPVSLEELIKLRLNALSPVIKNVLFVSAIMGYRFAVSILSAAVGINADKLQNILDYLKQELYIEIVDNYTYEFKSLELWKLIYQEAKSDLLYKENSQKLYEVLKSLTLSSNLQKLISCPAALSKQDEYSIWQETASISSKLGDTNLYIISMKQCLKILDEQQTDNAEEIKLSLYEQLGKLLCEKSSYESVSYLSNVLDYYIKSSNIKKILDIAGYFIKSCYLSGNYFGVSETVDAVIASVSAEDSDISSSELALIKTRKLKALFNIGNSEQIINLVNEDIIPEIEGDLNSRQIDSKFKSLLVDGWLCAKSVLAKAYALQGNSKVYEIISELRQFIEKYNYDSDFYVVQINLIEAFAYTITGEVNKSNEILSDILSANKARTIEPELLSEWNLINVINRILLNENEGLKSDLFELAAFTNNINEHFIKNIVKLILGYVLKEEGNTKKALEIFNEEITYFAKEKVAIGALLSWLLIVQITFESGDVDKALSTATKSLEIAQSPKINNYFFIIYFQKYIAEIYMKKGDLNASKMYFEKAVMLAKQYDLKYQIVELYMAYGNYMEEFMKASNNYSDENNQMTAQMYNKAFLLAKELKLNNLIEKTSRLKAEFKTRAHLTSLYNK